MSHQGQNICNIPFTYILTFTRIYWAHFMYHCKPKTHAHSTEYGMTANCIAKTKSDTTESFLLKVTYTYETVTKIKRQYSLFTVQHCRNKND